MVLNNVLRYIFCFDYMAIYYNDTLLYQEDSIPALWAMQYTLKYHPDAIEDWELKEEMEDDFMDLFSRFPDSFNDIPVEWLVLHDTLTVDSPI